jgi:peroxiredoxin
MMRTLALVALVPLLAGQAPKVPPRLKAGDDAPSFTVKTLDGKDRTSAVLRDEKKPKILVVVFWSHTCPWSRAWDSELTKIAKDYDAKNVRVIGIDSNDPAHRDVNNNADNPKDIERYRAEKSIGFEVYTDVQHRAASAFGAETTPDVFVIGTGGTIAYTGRINDMQNFARPEEFKKSYLRDALDALAAKRPVPERTTPPSGCGIRRSKA